LYSRLRLLTLHHARGHNAIRVFDPEAIRILARVHLHRTGLDDSRPLIRISNAKRRLPFRVKAAKSNFVAAFC
jgi:hypothetical protein